jgi:hypothetical protein
MFFRDGAGNIGRVLVFLFVSVLAKIFCGQIKGPIFERKTRAEVDR